jgi:hypothetical protein
MNCAKAVHPAFLIFKRKDIMILNSKQSKNEANTHKKVLHIFVAHGILYVEAWR